jgi:hypothetical protein
MSVVAVTRMLLKTENTIMMKANIAMVEARRRIPRFS